MEWSSGAFRVFKTLINFMSLSFKRLGCNERKHMHFKLQLFLNSVFKICVKINEQRAVQGLIFDVVSAL